MKPIKTALLGFGSGGRIYNAPIISSVPGFSIEKIFTSSPENVRAASSDFPEAQIISDPRDLFDDPHIELIVVLLPNHLHYEFTKEAICAGKHVVVEKPFTVTEKQGRELIQLAEMHRVILTVNHNRRWDSDVRTIQNLIQEGKLGKVVEYEAHFDRFRNQVKDSWKENKEIPGSGILYDLGSHLIDQALSLFGSPQEIFADIRIQREEARVPDNFHLILFYPELRVSLKAGMLVKEKGPAYSVFGTRGTFLKYGADVQEEALKKGGQPGDIPEWGQEPETLWGKLNTLDENRKVESLPGDYRKFYQNVYAAVRKGERLEVTPQQALNVIKVIERAQESHSSKRVVPFR